LILAKQPILRVAVVSEKHALCLIIVIAILILNWFIYHSMAPLGLSA